MEKRDEKAERSATSVAAETYEEAAPSMRTAETVLRLVPLALCVSALVVMLKNSESNEFGSLSYSSLGAFRYLVHANAVCAGYSLLSAVIAAVPHTSSSMPRVCTLFFLDQILTYVVLAAGAASTEVLYLAYKGDITITWSEACRSFSGFCQKATAAVIITFVVVAFYAVLSLVSSYKLFSRYEAPAVSHNKGIEVASFGG